MFCSTDTHFSNFTPFSRQKVSSVTLYNKGNLSECITDLLLSVIRIVTDEAFCLEKGVKFEKCVSVLQNMVLKS